MKRLTTISALTLCVALATVVPCSSKSKKDKSSSKTLDEYMSHFSQPQVPQQDSTLGSLWDPHSQLTSVASDYRALRIGDPITLQITESTLTNSNGSVNTQRQFSARTSVDGLAGKVNTSGLSPIFAGSGESSLKGAGSTAYNSIIKTTLAGQVVAMLPNGNLVVEAQRSVLMNNDHQMVLIRGMIRPSDIGPANAVLSTQLSNLEIEIKGKGIVADNTRPPNVVIRTLLKLIGY